MSELHGVIGIGVLAANAIVAAWGGIAWLRREPSVAFWYALRVAQAVVVIQVVIGFVLFARGLRAPDGLHLAYGISPLVVTLVTEAMRAGAAAHELEKVGGASAAEALPRAEQVALARRVVLREMAVMTIGALLIVTLTLRAVQSGGL